MSILRWFGLAISLIFGSGLFTAFRYSKIRRGDFVVGLLLALPLALVSLFPESVSLLRSMLALEDQQFSRLIAISIVSNIFLWLLLFYTRIQYSNQDREFDLLVRYIGAHEFERLYSQASALPEIIVIIPAYNEESNIGQVLNVMPAAVCGRALQTIVIDDGSSDNTIRVARAAGALVVASPLHRGGGAALRIGFDIARNAGARILVTMDADGQHLPSEIEQLVKPILENRRDFVIGSRILGQREKDSALRYMGILVFNGIIRLLTPVRITDCSSGFRALRVSQLNRVVLRQNQFHTSELIIDASKKGIRIGEAPITVKRRLSGVSKKGNNLIYGLSFIRTVLKTWWR